METKCAQKLIFGTQSSLNPGLTVGDYIQGSGLGAGIVTTGGLFIQNVFQNWGINKGPATNERIGSSIQNCKLVASISITALPYAAQPAVPGAFYNNSRYPKDLYMIVLRDRTVRLTQPDQLKILPNNTTYFIDGSAQSMLYPFNREKYIVYSCKRVARFKGPALEVSVDDPADAVLNTQIGSGDNIQFRNMKVRLPCPKELQFTKQYAGNTLPASEDKTVQNASLAVGFFYVDGSGMALPAKNAPFTCSMTLKLTYTDA